MKSLYLGLIGLLLVSACKSDKSEAPIKEELKEISVAEKIAKAHGLENWKNVKEIKFTFKVDRDSIEGKGRSWTWFPKEDRVILNDGEKTLDYLRQKMDSTHLPTDRAFINDKYWLLVPLQLVWDHTAKLSVPKFLEAPISKASMNMVTLTYPNEGGYTPGDAYDIYYDNNFKIKEWVFRKGNSELPSLTTTFENYKDYNGIKIATDHKQEGGSWNLNFTDVRVTLQE